MVELAFSAALALTLAWTFWSGFTDASNAISTVVGTRVLKPLQAVGLAAGGNLLGIFFGQRVAATIGRGIIEPKSVSGLLVISALLSGLLWDALTWYRGLPISESQVLVGSLIGAGIAAGGFAVVYSGSVVSRVLIPMATAPLVAFTFGLFLVVLLIRFFWRFPRHAINRYFGKLQVLSSLFFSITHGANDAQKSAGVIAALLVFYRMHTGPEIPTWTLLVSLLFLALGTLFGGWRIVKTMGFKLTRLQPYEGFCAETAAAIVVGSASLVGFPLSTSQTVAGSIMGVGAAKRASAVRWGVAREIVLAWALTIPVSAILAFLAYSLLLLSLSGQR